MGIFDFFSKDKKESLDKGLEKSRDGIFSKLTKAIAGKSKIDDEFLDELEGILIASDVGVETTLKIIKRIEERAARDKYVTSSELNTLLKDEIVQLLNENTQTISNTTENAPVVKPYVIMVVGVNGVGKTTTIGKLARQFSLQGKKVVIGAADTFRAAAVDQLKVWSERSGAEFISHGMNTDPASVAFDAVKRAVELNADIVLIDTAGRLHNKQGLMNELNKIKRVMGKSIETAPHEVMLVIDGSTGQNAFEQAKQFTLATDVSSLAVTKLDGTAKGGVVIGISDQFKIPVKYIGVGEKVEDLQVFDREAFVGALLGTDSK
jgi:fused signal recognition particle receptor